MLVSLRLLEDVQIAGAVLGDAFVEAVFGFTITLVGLQPVDPELYKKEITYLLESK